MAEFFRKSLMLASDWITFWRWCRSVRTDCRASFLEAEVNSDPAYLPAGVSAIAGGLWPA